MSNSPSRQLFKYVGAKRCINKAKKTLQKTCAFHEEVRCEWAQDRLVVERESIVGQIQPTCQLSAACWLRDSVNGICHLSTLFNHVGECPLGHSRPVTAANNLAL